MTERKKNRTTIEVSLESAKLMKYLKVLTNSRSYSEVIEKMSQAYLDSFSDYKKKTTYGGMRINQPEFEEVKPLQAHCE